MAYVALVSLIVGLVIFCAVYAYKYAKLRGENSKQEGMLYAQGRVIGALHQALENEKSLGDLLARVDSAPSEHALNELYEEILRLPKRRRTP